MTNRPTQDELQAAYFDRAETGARDYGKRRHAASRRAAVVDPRAWTHPRYPGDAVRIVYMTRIRPDSEAGSSEIGDVRIQDYGADCYHVAAFTPGYGTSGPGDTPKMNPDRDEWCSTETHANHEFNYQVARAHAEGWKDRT
jgi:hypothetical protein